MCILPGFTPVAKDSQATARAKKKFEPSSSTLTYDSLTTFLEDLRFSNLSRMGAKPYNLENFDIFLNPTLGSISSTRPLHTQGNSPGFFFLHF